MRKTAILLASLCLTNAAFLVAAASSARQETLLTGNVGGQPADVLIVHRGTQIIGAIYRRDGSDWWDRPVRHVHLLTGTRTRKQLSLQEWDDDGRPLGTISIASLKTGARNGSPLTNTTMTTWPPLERVHDAIRLREWDRAATQATLACALQESECHWRDVVRSREIPRFSDNGAICRRHNDRLACEFYLDDLQQLEEHARRETLKMMCRNLRLGCETYWGKNEVALIDAARAGDLTTVESLLKTDVNVNAGEGELFTPIQAAVVARSLPVVRALLEHGANPNNPVQESGSGIHMPLEFALMNGMDDITKVLVAHGATASSALWIAAANGQYEIAKKLMDNGMDVEDAGPAGSALQAAVEHCDTEMVKLLLAHGADPDFSTKFSGGSPMTLAREKHEMKILKLLSDKQRENEEALATSLAHERQVSTMFAKVKCGMSREDVGRLQLGSVGGTTTEYGINRLLISNDTGSLSLLFRDDKLVSIILTTITPFDQQITSCSE